MSSPDRHPDACCPASQMVQTLLVPHGHTLVIRVPTGTPQADAEELVRQVERWHPGGARTIVVACDDTITVKPTEPRTPAP